MKLLIKFPTRARPRLFRRTLDQYYEKLSGKHQVSFVITMDNDDRPMNNPTIHGYLRSKPNLTYFYGANKCKVQAINANVSDQQFDVLMLASDDMIPEIHGYDDCIITNMQTHYPQLDGCLHFNDGRQASCLNTLSIMGRGLYDHFGYIYHPDYKSLWCDNEYTEVTKQMNKVVYFDSVIIKHMWTKVTREDALFRRNQKFNNKDAETYSIRRDRGFPKESIN